MPILATVQGIEKLLLLFLCRLNNIKLSDAKTYLTKRHFNFVIGEIQKNNNIDIAFKNDIENLRQMRNILMHDFIYLAMQNPNDLQAFYNMFCRLCSKIAKEIQNICTTLIYNDDLKKDDFLYKEIFIINSTKIKDFLKLNY